VSSASQPVGRDLRARRRAPITRAVFLDRDGVLVEDVDLLTRAGQIRALPGAAEALRRLKSAGFLLIVVSNQPVIARGLISEPDLEEINRKIERLLQSDGAPKWDASYFCPHHPNATLQQYRIDCDCRKPRPGLLRRASDKFRIDLQASFMVGDRITDVAAGAAAGCRTVLVQTGKHTAPTITLTQPLDPSLAPDWTCADLAAAADWILRQQ